MPLGLHKAVATDLEQTDVSLRARCKAQLYKLGKSDIRLEPGLRIEKINNRLYELKVKWNKQEFRFLYAILHGDKIILHFFQKKSAKLKGREIDVATKRLTELDLNEVFRDGKYH